MSHTCAAKNYKSLGERGKPLVIVSVGLCGCVGVYEPQVSRQPKNYKSLGERGKPRVIVIVGPCVSVSELQFSLSLGKLSITCL